MATAAPVAVAAVAMVIREVVGAMVGARLAEAEAVFVAAVAALVAAGMGDAPGAWRVAQPVVVGRWALDQVAVVADQLSPSPNFASASRPPAFCAFACRIGLLSALSHTHSACLRFTEVVGCKSRCVAPCWHVPRGSKGAPLPLALERATGTASAHC